MANNKEVKYNGCSAVPSDYESPDGDLALSINLIPEDGALRPLLPPSLIFGGEGEEDPFRLPVGHTVFIHKVGAVENYIGYTPRGNRLYWFYTKTDGLIRPPREIEVDPDFGNIVSIASVGYIIVISTDTDLYFIRYDAKEKTYVFLGTRLPDISLDLALKLNFTVSDIQDKTFEVTSDSGSTRAETPDDGWNTLLAASYDVSGSDGLSRDTENNSYVTTDYIPFDGLLRFDPDIEYRLKWDVIAGTHSGTLQIHVFGKRNGSSELEMIFWRVNSDALANSIDTITSFGDEWTDICYRIRFRWTGSLDDRNCGTKGTLTWFKGLDSSGAGSSEVSAYIEYTSDSHDAIMGAVNRFVNEQVSGKSRFIYPFHLRYALRMYDGSYAFISEPVLMVPNSGYVPAVRFSKHYRLGTRLVLSSFAADIHYRAKESLSCDWQDLIGGIDFFVSQPVWAYDQGQSYDGSTNYFRFYGSVDSLGFGKAYFNDSACDPAAGFATLSLADCIGRYAGDTTAGYVMIAPRSTSDIMKDTASVSSFYKIASIAFSEINDSVTQFTPLEIEKGVLSALAAREALVDDVLRYEGFKSSSLKEYNGRLHLCGSSVILPRPAHPASCFNFIDSEAGVSLKTLVLLATDDGRKAVGSRLSGNASGPWFFYPDSRAYKAYFIQYGTHNEVLHVAGIDLKRHDFLNGAYWCADSLADTLPWQTDDDPSDGLSPDNSVAAPSTVYVSETGCPFVFRAGTAVSVGATTVFALSSAAKALSQGQFGQFPLYAFTSEGVWALEVSATGTYSARQPVTRDVCINTDGITQLDSAVLFPTDRGIMLISGSKTQCISDAVASEHPFDASALPGFTRLHSLLGHLPASDTCLPTLPFSAFLRRCRMVYDYVNQRVLVYAPGISYAYVFSLESRQWGMTFSCLDSHLNSYPEALAVDSDNNIVNVSLSSASETKALFLTRPLKLDAPDVHKTVDSVIQRGFFRKGHLATALYGSRDLVNWHLVWSSKDHCLRGFRGTPYKYFRIAGVATLDADENIFGASVQFSPRLTDRPR